MGDCGLTVISTLFNLFIKSLSGAKITLYLEPSFAITCACTPF